MDVLVTDGITKHALTVVRAIAPAVDRVGVVSDYPVSVAGVSRHADAHYQLRSSADPGRVDELNHIVRRDDYDRVMPVGGESFELCSAFRDRLAVPVDRFLPAHAAVETALDKLASHRLAREHDVPSPTTVRPDGPDHLDAVAERVGLPAVVKAAHENDERFVEVVDSEAALRRAYERASERSDDPLVQAHLSGEGCGYFGLYVDGEAVGGYSHRRIREYPPSGGASACAQSYQNDHLTTLGERLLDALEWHGVAMVEFKRDADGVPHLMEINPKFWGSLELGVRSGMNFPRALLAATDGDPDVRFRPRRVHWPLSGDLQHAVRRPSSAPGVLSDLLSSQTESNLDASDPLPHAVELGKALASAVR
jgi:predicted ATP-grasp superfamily ATP-dependent carboligase